MLFVPNQGKNHADRYQVAQPHAEGGALQGERSRRPLYAAVRPAGSISFRYNYSIHGRQETVSFGRYGNDGITLAEACERLGEAKKMIAAGKSPAKV